MHDDIKKGQKNLKEWVINKLRKLFTNGDSKDIKIF
jgi:hypothetical protein